MDGTPAQQMQQTEQAQQTQQTAQAQGASPADRDWMHGPLPEIIGYVGAALIASAGLNFVAQSWEQWSDLTRISIISVAIVALYAGAVALLVMSGGRRGLAEHANRRRLAAVIVALAAPLVGALAAVIIDVQGWAWNTPNDPWPVVPAIFAFTAAAVGAWLVQGVMTTLAMAATSAWLIGTTMVAIVGDGPGWWIPILGSIGGALWLAAAPRVLAAPALCESLGVAWLIVLLGPVALTEMRGAEEMAEMPQDLMIAAWVSRGILLVFAAVALTVFARGGDWAWAVGGILAAAIAATAIAGQTLGWIAALLVAGVVLLALSGLLIALRARTEAARGQAEEKNQE